MPRPIYTAPNEDAARMALAALADSNLGKKYPATVASWQAAWDRFIPFLAFGPAMRKAIDTTNSIESLNFQLRKGRQEPRPLPSDDAVVKLLWLASNIEDKRAPERAKEAGLPEGTPREAPGRLVEGSVVHGWKPALGELHLIYRPHPPPTADPTVI